MPSYSVPRPRDKGTRSPSPPPIVSSHGTSTSVLFYKRIWLCKLLAASSSGAKGPR